MGQTSSQSSSPRARLIDGKSAAINELARVRAAVTARVAAGLPAPGLAVVLVGGTAADRGYVQRKRLACEQTGVSFTGYDLPPESSEAAVRDAITQANLNPAIDGILLQFPLPAHLMTATLVAALDPGKDIDCCHPDNIRRLEQRKPLVHPCTPYAILTLWAHHGITIAGRDALVVGTTPELGRPMALELQLADARVTACDPESPTLRAQVERADILVATAGKARCIPGHWIRSGAIVADAGLNRLADGTLVGDVEFGVAAQRAAWITPVPGVVGPMTIAMILRHTLDAAVRRERTRNGG